MADSGRLSLQALSDSPTPVNAFRMKWHAVCWVMRSSSDANLVTRYDETTILPLQALSVFTLSAAAAFSSPHLCEYDTDSHTYGQDRLIRIFSREEHKLFLQWAINGWFNLQITSVQPKLDLKVTAVLQFSW